MAARLVPRVHLKQNLRQIIQAQTHKDVYKRVYGIVLVYTNRTRQIERGPSIEFIEPKSACSSSTTATFIQKVLHRLHNSTLLQRDLISTMVEMRG